MAFTVASPRLSHPHSLQTPEPMAHEAGVSQGVYILGDDTVLEHMQAVAAALVAQPSVHHSVQSFGQPFAQPTDPAVVNICIIPFSEQMTATQAWIDQHPHISQFDDRYSIRKWETFYEAVWMSQPVAHRLSERYAKDHGQVKYARKFCAFDGIFQAFVVYDAVRGNSQFGAGPKPVSSNLATVDFRRLNLPEFLSQLDRYDLIVEDWEWLRPSPSTAIDVNYLWQSEQKPPVQGSGLRNRLHGAQFFAAKAQLFSPELLTQLCHQLIDQGETRWINTLRWWDEAALFSYMTLRLDARILNGTRAQASANPLLAFDQAMEAVQYYVLAE